MTRIAIAGAAGRMGRNLVLACSEADDVVLTQALEREQSPALGSDSGLLAGIPENQVMISDRLDAESFDILIDRNHSSSRFLPAARPQAGHRHHRLRQRARTENVPRG